MVSEARAAEGEGSEDVEGKDDFPEAHGLPEVAFFGEDEGDGVEGVFGEELGAAEDDDDEAEGVEHLADEEDGVAGDGARRREERDGDGVAEGGEAHEDSAGEGRRWRGRRWSGLVPGGRCWRLVRRCPGRWGARGAFVRRGWRAARAGEGADERACG